MGDSQLIIKMILIGAFAVLTLLLLLPERGSRRLAIRRIALLIVFVAIALGIAFPGVVDTVARHVGVGRGTDLLLYILFVTFVGHAIASARRNRQLEAQVTALARRQAIDSQRHQKERGS